MKPRRRRIPNYSPVKVTPVKEAEPIEEIKREQTIFTARDFKELTRRP